MTQPPYEKVEAALRALESLELVDLSHEMSTGIPVWPTLPGFRHRRIVSMDQGAVCNADELTLTDHCGTHVDAPGHYRAQGPWIGDLPADTFWGRGIMIRPESPQAGDDIEPAVIHDWESQHGVIQPGDIVFFDLGWSQLWANLESWPSVVEGWPGLSETSAELLVQRQVKAVGLDALSVDSSARNDDASHKVLLEAGIVVVENLAHLDDLPPVFVTAFFPWKIREGSASPARAVAWIDR